RFLKNIMGLWLVQECRRQWVKDGHDHSYAELKEMAGRAKPFGAVIDPDHKPFLSPGDMPGKVERFCRDTRQRTPTTPGEYVHTCAASPGHGFISQRLFKSLPFRFMRWRLGLGEYGPQTERELERKLSETIAGTEKLDAAVVLAFDAVHDPEGRMDEANTHLY